MIVKTRLLLGFTLLLSLIVAAIGASAQDEAWSVFLADTLRGEIIEVQSDGTSNVIDLNLGERTYFGARNVAIDAGNTRAAFCATVIRGEDMASNVLYIYDLNTGERITERDYGQTGGCMVTTAGMSPDGSSVVVSIFNAYPTNDPSSQPNVPMWTVEIVDTNTGNVIETIDADSEIVPEDGFRLENFLAVLPVVQAYDGEQVIFVVMPYGTEGIPVAPTFTWTPAAGSITPADEQWGRMNVAYLPATGEMAWVALDENVPAADPGGPIPRANVVRLMGADGEVKTVYSNSDYVLSNVEFVNNGEQLGISLLEPFNMDAPEQQQEIIWLGLNRDGSTEELTRNRGFNEIAPVPGGFVNLTGMMSDNGQDLTVTLTAHENGEARELWRYEGENRGIVWGIVKSPRIDVMENLPEF